jgi:hypothetical protein
MSTIPPPAREDDLELDLETRSRRPSGMAPRGTSDIADRLVAAGLLGDRDRNRAAAFARARNVRMEDAIIDLGFMKEADLLRTVATWNRTRFVSTEQLARASIAPALLQIVPAKAAELCGVFPVLWDAASGTLSVVVGDPGDTNALHDVRLASAGVRRVVALAARPAAVRAAIARHYHGDRWAFQALGRPAELADYMDGAVVVRAPVSSR